jgi:aminopeptidase N
MLLAFMALTSGSDAAAPAVLAARAAALTIQHYDLALSFDAPAHTVMGTVGIELRWSRTHKSALFRSASSE